MAEIIRELDLINSTNTIEFLVRFHELWSQENLSTNYVFGELKKREIHTSDGFGENFLLKITFDEGLEEWLAL